jgi:hypothetical protein
VSITHDIVTESGGLFGCSLDLGVSSAPDVAYPVSVDGWTMIRSCLDAQALPDENDSSKTSGFELSGFNLVVKLSRKQEASGHP